MAIYLVSELKYELESLMSITLRYRKAKMDDLQAIISLLHDDELGKARESLDSNTSIRYETAMTRILKDGNQALMVAENNEGIVGTYQLSFIQYLTYTGGLRAQIEAVRIKNTMRGLGVGKVMVADAINFAKKQGAHVVQLTTDKQRPDAIKFYESLGFRASHEGMKLHI